MGLTDRTGRRWGRLVPLVAALGVTAVLSACASSGAGLVSGATAPTTASQAPDSAPPAVTSSTQATPSGPPTAHYILMCSVQQVLGSSSSTGTLTWLDPTTLQVLYQETIIPPPAATVTLVPVGDIAGTSGFVPTTPAVVNTATPVYTSFGEGCGAWQLSADGTSIAGINVEDNSAVPATYNLITGAITDVVQPPSTSSFAATTPVTYIGAYYAPDGTSVWSLQCDGSDDDLTLHAPDGKVEANIPSTVTDSGGAPFCDNATMSDPYLVWLPGASTATIVTAGGPASGSPYPYNLVAIPMASGGAETPLTVAQTANQPLLDPSALPQSNWAYSYIHRSPDGSQAAFIAQNNTTQAWALFTVGGTGTGTITPQQVNATLPGCSATCGDVLAYSP